MPSALVHPPLARDPYGALGQLRALLDLAHALRASGGLQPVLEAVARTMSTAVGFGTVVVNLYRPAWDDFEVVVVHGSPAAREVLLGEYTTWADWQGLLDDRFERRGTYLIPRGEYDWDANTVSWVPPAPAVGGPDAWDPEDALMVPLRAADGRLLGVVSLDEPVDGRRPTDDRLEVLAAVAAHAATAVERAQQAAEGARHHAAVEHLLRVSAQLTSRRSPDEMLDAVCAAVRDALAFQRVMVILAEGPDRRLVPRAGAGWSAAELAALPALELADIAVLLRPENQREGCVLLEREDAEALVGHGFDVPPSRCNGRGPLAWRRHWLVVPLHDRDGAIEGVLWVDDPADRLVPTTERLQALRAFANQAMSAIDSARQLEHLRHLAAHDPLTGLRNRRDFEPHLDAALRRADERRPVSVLIFDLDHFKRVNDRLGHEVGDDVLRRFADVLRRGVRSGDTPVRLGGEEFAIVLTGADAAAATAVGERLRRAVREEFRGFPVPISVSIGVADSGVDAATAAELLRAANRALYAAKRLGRDRCVAHDPETLSLLEDLGDAGGATDDQLAAAILLAETLDLRDLGTSRHSQTVGRLAELAARELGWPAARVERVRAAGVLHDIGKLGISDAILHKAGRLEDAEWEEMRRHPEIGARILEHANLRDVAAWVLAHHERIDGEGYPSGLDGAAIPPESRVLAVADAYEAMTADRPYRRALPVEDAQAELRRCAGTQFDADVVEALLRGLDAAG